MEKEQKVEKEEKEENEEKEESLDQEKLKKHFNQNHQRQDYK